MFEENPLLFPILSISLTLFFCLGFFIGLRADEILYGEYGKQFIQSPAPLILWVDENGKIISNPVGNLCSYGKNKDGRKFWTCEEFEPYGVDNTGDK